jgi:hypothetical protein
MSDFISGSLYFPPDFLPSNISEADFSIATHLFIQIFNLDPKFIPSLDNSHYGQLIIILGVANNKSRCKKAIEYIIDIFKSDLHKVWIPNFNFIFLETFQPPDPKFDLLDVLSHILYKKDFINLSQEENFRIIEISYTLKEIFCLIQIIRARLVKKVDIPLIELFSLLEKFNLIFQSLFQFTVAEVTHKGLLSPYKKCRNAVAHSNYILHEGDVKFVEWEGKRITSSGKTIKVRSPKHILDYNVHEITYELTLLCGIVSQICALYELMQEINMKKSFSLRDRSRKTKNLEKRKKS